MFVALIDVSECKLVIVFGLAEVGEDEVELCGESEFQQEGDGYLFIGFYSKLIVSYL